jgi:hypothetical protein
VLEAVEQTDGVQKLYTFGETDGKDATVLDMNAPLTAFDGRTAAEVSQAAI